MFRTVFFFVVAAVLPSLAAGQSTFWSSYHQRVADTQRNQPGWAAPLVTVSPRIEQGFRTDFVRQTTPSDTSWNLGGSKGLQFIAFARTEIRLSLPPFFTHSDGQVIDGFGDPALRIKTRLYGSNEQHHDAMISAELSASLPTGKQGNGSCCAIVMPSLEVAKGLRALVLTSQAVGSLPASNTVKLGRSIGWNNSLQYRVNRVLWPEAEITSTFYEGGRNDGKQQTFLTPGLIASRLPLSRSLAVSLGAGEQIALTHFNTYNHSPIFTARLRF